MRTWLIIAVFLGVVSTTIISALCLTPGKDNQNSLSTKLLDKTRRLLGLKTSAELREEEIERMFKELIKSCLTMLDKQTGIHHRFKELHKRAESRPGKKPSEEDTRTALALAGEVGDLIEETTVAIEMLRTPDTAIASPRSLSSYARTWKCSGNACNKAISAPPHWHSNGISWTRSMNWSAPFAR